MKQNKSNIYTHLVPEINAPVRLQEYCIGIFDLLPGRSAVKKAIKKDWITVNNCPATTATYIKGGEIIKCEIPFLDNAMSKKIDLHLNLLYEDDYLAIISKPAGIIVSGNKFRTIANALTNNLRKSIIDDAVMPQPVHRLDYETTGVLLVGKTISSIRYLNKLFENKKVQKKYFAICIGEIPKDGNILSSIENKTAKTSFKLIDSIESARFLKLNLLEISIDTGRRHQIRKHLYELGNPILGDREYGKTKLILKGKGLYLHAYSLNFVHPFTNEDIYITSPIPKKFRKLFPNYFN